MRNEVAIPRTHTTLAHMSNKPKLVHMAIVAAEDDGKLK